MKTEQEKTEEKFKKLGGKMYRQLELLGKIQRQVESLEIKHDKINEILKLIDNLDTKIGKLAYNLYSNHSIE